MESNVKDTQMNTYLNKCAERMTFLLHINQHYADQTS